MSSTYDVLIVGSGPAGLTAGIYASRYQLKTLIVSSVLGGTLSKAHQICNYPSWSKISGRELAVKFQEHAKIAGAQIKSGIVAAIEKDKNFFKINTQAGKEYQAKTLLLATGMEHRQLNLASEQEYLGKGVSYCFTCDGMFFKGKTVAVAGGSDAAITAALYFSEICPQVYLIYRGKKLRAEPAWINLFNAKKNISAIYNSNIIQLKGKNKLEAVILDREFAGKKELACDGLFVEIGGEPNRKLSQMLGLELDEDGYIKTSSAGRTNVDGVWAAGDLVIASKGFRQIITACSQGAQAARDIFGYLQQK
ncbi:MAG: FAD-dependent oxidoreductase [Candidatus Shapirobacteria bacterium]